MGCMEIKYPEWFIDELVNELDYFEDSYIYQNKYKVYTCGYSLIREWVSERYVEIKEKKEDEWDGLCFTYRFTIWNTVVYDKEK